MPELIRYSAFWPGSSPALSLRGSGRTWRSFRILRLNWTVLRLAADLVEIVHEVHAQPRGVDGALHEPAEVPGVVDDGEDLLHAAEREDRDEKGTAAPDRLVDACHEAGHLGATALVRRPLGGAPRGLHDQRVEVAGRKFGPLEGPLVLEHHVPGEENGALLVPDLDAAGPDHVARRVEDDLDLVLGPPEALGMPELEADQPLAQRSISSWVNRG